MNNGDLREDTVELFFNIYLTENGKTLITIYENHKKLVEAFTTLLGEPEYMERGEYNHNCLHLLFSRQDMPEPLKDLAERITSHQLLMCLSTGISVRNY